MRALTAAAPPLLAACLLLTLPGCTSGASAPAAARGSADAEPPAGGVAAPPGAERLEKAALAADDLPGFQVSADTALTPDGRPRADRAACRPLAEAMGDRPGDRARHSVHRGLGSLEHLGLAVSVSLSSYEPSDAAGLTRGIRSALDACAGGFEASLDGRTAAYGPVRRTAYTVPGADETVSWTALARTGGTETALHLVVVREGAAVARFMALDLAGRTPPRVPREVADAQLAKLLRTVSS
ncbi:hypothetical protein [Streptomyces sp. NPDC005805]|uniref:hypothetical protein n=1 Tax=Streptomyces sp. NPDC005805 TaxID=3157068 RepID=UPI0033DB88C3